MSISSAQVGNLMGHEAIPSGHRDGQSRSQWIVPEEFNRFEAMIVQSNCIDALDSNCIIQVECTPSMP